MGTGEQCADDGKGPHRRLKTALNRVVASRTFWSTRRKAVKDACYIRRYHLAPWGFMYFDSSREQRDERCVGPLQSPSAACAGAACGTCAGQRLRGWNLVPSRHFEGWTSSRTSKVADGDRVDLTGPGVFL
jgi:hypothetical protein